MFGILLRSTSFTSADLFADRNVQNNRFSITTLAFNDLNTANNYPIIRLFDITGLVPGGFAVNSFRIKKTGQLNFKYNIFTEVISGDPSFCQSLEIQLMQNSIFKNQSGLTDFQYQSTIDTNIPQDWVIFLRLNQNNPPLRQQNCQFNLVITTQDKNKPNGGLFARKTLLNSVTSGNWD